MYSYTGIIKISFRQVMRMFRDDREVYLLHKDNTESLAKSIQDIEIHNEKCLEFGRE